MESVVKKKIIRIGASSYEDLEDYVASEEPLEVFVNDGKVPLLVTMRTPGEDHLLVTGLLFSMGLIGLHDRPHFQKQHQANSLRVKFKGEIAINTALIPQNSSCGFCNRSSWEDVKEHSLFPVFESKFIIDHDSILKCHKLLTKREDNFALTGGNHKITLLDVNLKLITSAEDVGRHNAFDKVVGQCYLENKLPLSSTIAILSGRCSYEMCQKAWQAGIPIIVALGAPTSKAIELADSAGVTLIGFAKTQSFNIYTHPQRIRYERS